MTITGQSSLNKDEIDRMVRDAEAHAEEDRRRRAEAEVRNTADSLVYQTERLLKDQGEKVPAGEREPVEAAIRSLQEALKGNDVEAIRRGTEAVATASEQVGRRLYEQAASSEFADDDEVVDAEIVDERQSA